MINKISKNSTYFQLSRINIKTLFWKIIKCIVVIIEKLKETCTNRNRSVTSDSIPMIRVN